MEKKQLLGQFIKQRIQNLDQNINKEKDVMSKLKIATLRSTYSNLIEIFLNDSSYSAKSHYEQAKVYLEKGKTQQAINQARISKKKLQKNKDISLSENIDLLLVQSFMKSKKYQDALTLVEQIEVRTKSNLQKYFSLKGQIHQSLRQQIKSEQSYKNLYQLIIQQYGKGSTEQGLCLIEMGKNQAQFQKYQQAISLINQGMEVLIRKRYNKPVYVSKIYEILSDLNRKIEDYEKQHSALICAYSMIKQLEENQEKRTIEILTKLATNLEIRCEKQKALQQLFKIQVIQRKIYGESSQSLAKTVKKMIILLNQLSRSSEAKKYEVQYQHLIGSRVAQKIDPSSASRVIG